MASCTRRKSLESGFRVEHRIGEPSHARERRWRTEFEINVKPRHPVMRDVEQAIGLMRYLTIGELLELHRRIIEQSGGASGIRELGLAAAARAQPQMTFGGTELYPTLAKKAAGLCFSLVMNHPFVDGNKRIGHAAMETFLVMNGCELTADVDDAESVILGIAAGEIARLPFTEWVVQHVTEVET